MVASKRIVSLYIPEKFVEAKVVEKLEAIAEKADRSLNAIIVRILAKFVEEQSASNEPKASKAPKIAETPVELSPGETT